jgi:putative flavoprotein involved in K+ transport
MTTKQIDTLIVGGGQAGLSTSYYLSQQGNEHIVLERSSHPAHVWRDDRWDSFTLVTPNWAFRIPGAEYRGDDPDGFMPREQIVARFEEYPKTYRLPVQYGVDVFSIEHENEEYSVHTNQGDWRANNVVIATGLFQTPKIPASSANLPEDILQLPTEKYRNPSALPDGAVLVVGSGQSGCQIAEELYQSGRKVYLCVGSAGRAPRRYRGKDIFEWIILTGFFSRTPDQLPSPQARFGSNPHVSGKNGGHTLNLHQFTRDGVTLLGRFRQIQDENIILAPDLKENLGKADQLEAQFIRMIDEYIEKMSLDAPTESLPRLEDGYAASDWTSLNLRSARIQTIIWAMGYSFDFSLVKLPVFDSFGFPIQKYGLTRVRGLYFVGMPWLLNQKTGLLVGVGELAESIAASIAESR